MPDGLYDQDVLIWSDQQADLLRRLAAGERVNDAVDWTNVIEEVQDVGQSQLRSCRGLLRQAMLHLLKLHAWPTSRSVGHWGDEVDAFLSAAEDHFTPSMRQHLGVAGLYAKALRSARRANDQSGAARILPDACPFMLDALLAGDVDGLLATLAAAASD